MASLLGAFPFLVKLYADASSTVRFKQMFAPQQWPCGMFDLILPSEVVYYFATRAVCSMHERRDRHQVFRLDVLGKLLAKIATLEAPSMSGRSSLSRNAPQWVATLLPPEKRSGYQSHRGRSGSRGRYNDKQADDVEIPMPTSVSSWCARQLTGACRGALIRGFAHGFSFSSSTSSAACQKNR